MLIPNHHTLWGETLSINTLNINVMKTKMINFTVVRIGQSNFDGHFAVLKSDAPTSQLGGLSIVGKSEYYGIDIASVPEGVKLTEKKENGKKFTKEVDLESFEIQHVQRVQYGNYEPVGYRVKERIVEGEDGIERIYKWLVKIEE